MSSAPIFAILAVLLVSIEAYQQTVTVKGQLLCGDKPATSKDTWVKLLNKRTGFDDQKEVPVQADGTFQITLTANRLFELTPELHIYTNCNNKIFGITKGCQRKLKIKIPEKYVSNGNNGQVYDIGTINMESKFYNEERDCSIRRFLTG